MQSYPMAVGSSACPTIQPPQPKAPTYGKGCTHCAIPKHTRETCYKLHGYGGKDTKVEKLRLDLVVQLSSPPNLNYHWFLRPDPPSPRHLLMTPRFWATQVTVALYFILLPQVLLLTFDQNDFLSTSLCHRTSVANANGIAYPVTRAGAIALSSSLSLSNTLFVLPLCNKLLFVGEATKNCMQC